MAQASVLYSQSLQNLDGINSGGTLYANPIIANTSGEGAPASLVQVSDTVSPLSADTTSSVYHFVRIPTSAHVKKVTLYSHTIATAGAADFNVVFSDAQNDGTSAGNQGTIPQVASANNKLFGAAQSILATGSPYDLTYANITNYPYGSENEPLWAVLGFATDPGGFFDINAYVTTAVTTGGQLDLKVDFTVPGMQ